MYLPQAFAADDPDIAWTIVEESPFGILFDPATATASHIPFLVKRDERDRPVSLLGHVARANPAASLASGARVLAVFQGPHCYVSPRWYERPREEVPTWNYVITHAWGRTRPLERAELRALLDALCERFDGPGGFLPEWLDADFLDELLEEIVGFELVVERIEAKLKLSQNRSPADRRRVVEGLEDRDGPEDRAVARWMRRVLPDV